MAFFRRDLLEEGSLPFPSVLMESQGALWNPGLPYIVLGPAVQRALHESRDMPCGTLPNRPDFDQEEDVCR